MLECLDRFYGKLLCAGKHGKTMKILQVIGVIRKAAGTSLFCLELADALKRRGHNVAVAVLDLSWENAYPSKEGVSVGDAASFWSGPFDWDVVHLHGLWEIGLWRFFLRAKKSHIKVVWSPHGTITPWAMAHRGFKKRVLMELFLRRFLSNADILHVTAQSEAEDAARLRIKTPVAIVPLGADICFTDAELSEIKERKPNNNHILLFVSRVHRKKGLLNLVRAWKELPDEIKCGWKVRIVGPDQDGHVAELQDECHRLNVSDWFDFVGPKYDLELKQEYATADLFVLPTFSENFGSVVLEAMACCVPVICTKGAPWSGLESHKAGLWIDVGVEPLCIALKRMMMLSDDERHNMGLNGRIWVERDFAWNSIAEKMIRVYGG